MFGRTVIDATIVRGVLVPATMKLWARGTGTSPGGSSGFPARRQAREARRFDHCCDDRAEVHPADSHLEGPVTQSVQDALAARDALLSDAAGRARSYLDGISDRRVSPDPSAVEALDAFDVALPSDGADPAEVLAFLDTIGSPATVAMTGPRYFGFVNGGTLPIALATAWLTTAWDQNAALTVMSPVASRLDEIALGWVGAALGLPAGLGGAFVSGATMANATALAAARDAVLTRAGWDAHRDGLVGAPPITVWVGGEAHSTVSKALGVVGLGRGRARILPSDEQGRVIADDLPTIDGPSIVCLQAGNVNSGASDPFLPLVEWAHAQGAWVHVDGAFGLWAAASRFTRDQVAGVAAADSWAVDAHKWLNVSYDSGIVLVRDPELLRAAVRLEAPYLVAGTSRDPMHHTPQSSQRARGVEVWAVLATLGRTGLADLIDRNCAMARRFASTLEAGGCQILNDVVLNQVVVALGDEADRIIAEIQADGTCWAGPTTWQGHRAMRLSVSNWSTTEVDVDRSAAAIIAAVRRAQS
jgi:glutamate/tyrosine decarboxylase-like PLP-dependent enzyme